jgi:ANTAR domain
MPTPTTSRRRLPPRALHTTVSPSVSTVVARGHVPAAAVPVVGRYRCDRRAENWWWSPEMFLLHGLVPDAAPPCLQLLLDHVHPADRARTAEALGAACNGSPFSLELRAVRSAAPARELVLVGEPTLDGDGAVAGVDGLCVDVTEGRRGAEDARVHDLETEVAQMRTAMASRAAIEQAKGILMLLTSCGDQVAFDLLAHISSHTHRKVREVALAITESASGHGRLPDDIRAILHDACPPSVG